MKNLTLALDWTPNINHIGFFVAKEKNFYQENGLNLNIIDPTEDNYKVTPAKKVELGLADFALCPTESILSYRTKTTPFNLIAIAAILKDDLSAIVVKNNGKIKSPKDLDGKSYSSYQAKYEDAIVKQMIKNDGGKGDLTIAYPNKLGIWDTVLNDAFDATWIFLNWEAIEAEGLDHSVSYFKMKDYHIPYSYSPVIAANENKIQQNASDYTKFLSATKAGYLFCQEHEEEAITLFKKYVPEKDAHINLNKALKASLDAFGNNENWGKLETSVISEFLDWIYAKDLETQKIMVQDIATNQLMI
ncbi:MAG: ABC transporter substrate-binding protein [Winogradskyella sp.]|uniref:ABC transporter substrate-binding protein n=1 Tax=Winogradskyella sp. TaxID=1883156 RepID=UPI0038592D2D